MNVSTINCHGWHWRIVRFKGKTTPRASIGTSVDRLGVNLTPIIIKRNSQLKDLAGKRLAVDASNFIYQFLSVVRTRESYSFTGPDGSVTSHLIGILYRITHLVSQYNMSLVFVFDGVPPKLKSAELERRRTMRNRAQKEWEESLQKGDYEKAFSKAVVSSHLTPSIVQDAKKLLTLLGVPHVQAPSEAEAQAAYMAANGDVWAVSSKDYDSLLFGAPRLVRYLTIYGKEFLSSKGIYRSLTPEIVDLQRLLSKHCISHSQLVDIAILVGTDFNRGVKGIGPKTALKLIKEYKSIEGLPDKIKARITDDYEIVRRIFLYPEVASNYQVLFSPLNEDYLIDFLCNKKGFSKIRVENAVNKLKGALRRTRQPNLDLWT